MLILGGLGSGAFILVSVVLGLRLMWLAKRTRGLPEFVLGLSLFLLAGLGYPLMVVATVVPSLPHGLRMGLFIGHMLTVALGMSVTALFTQYVFRRGVAWAKAATAAIFGGYAALFTFQALGPGLAVLIHSPNEGPWSFWGLLGFCVCIWAGVEPFRYHLLLRRRLALGLADPVVSNRCLLWSMSLLISSTLTILSFGLQMAGVPMVESPVAMLVVGVLGLVAACCLWLAFLPPAAFLSRVRSRAAAREGV